MARVELGEGIIYKRRMERDNVWAGNRNSVLNNKTDTHVQAEQNHQKRKCRNTGIGKLSEGVGVRGEMDPI